MFHIFYIFLLLAVWISLRCCVTLMLCLPLTYGLMKKVTLTFIIRFYFRSVITSFNRVFIYLLNQNETLTIYILDITQNHILMGPFQSHSSHFCNHIPLLLYIRTQKVSPVNKSRPLLTFPLKAVTSHISK